MKGILKFIGFLIGAFFLTNIATIFIVGLQVPLFSEKYWALYAFCSMILYTFLELWKSIKVKKED